MAELTLIRSTAEDAILNRFADYAARQSHWGGPAIARRRQDAFETLKAKGLPTRRVEEWKYTDLRAVMRDLPPLAGLPERAQVDTAEKTTPLLQLVDACRFLFVNGQDFSSAKADGVAWYRLGNDDDIPDSVRAALNREQLYAANAAVALNAAFMHDITVLHVTAGTTVATPLHLDFRTLTAEPLASFGRVLVVLEAGASATLIETHQGPHGVAYQANTLIECDIGDGAALTHIRCNAAGDAALSLSTLGLHLGQKARANSFAMTFGGAVARHQIFATLAGEGTELILNGATLLRGRQHADTTMVMDHAHPHCTGRELFKSVLDDESRSVFQGKIVVRPDAQKTDAKMSAHALLLSENAEANAKPELEIFADDVVCGHGATVGALDDDLLFYLKARGIPQKQAEALMIEAFVGETVETVDSEPLRDALMDLTRDWLSKRS
jgi:Fe-S cluster assembly protein SufD